jgi:transcriptional regulator with XRE-family HTH domain
MNTHGRSTGSFQPDPNGVIHPSADSGRSTLGAFIRAHRSRLSPDDVGIRSYGERRVPGLRREELAQLAGLSVPYLARLEQERDRRPSSQVLGALATALRLSPDEARFMHQLVSSPSPHAANRPANAVSDATREILDGLADRPALLLSACRDVLAATPVASALCPGFVPGENILQFVFLDPRAKHVYINWTDVATEAVRTLRTATNPADGPERQQLVSDLSAGSQEFARLWARFEVREKTIGIKRFRHPDLGEIALDYSTLTLNDSTGQILSVYRATPGSPAEAALRILTQTSRQL